MNAQCMNSLITDTHPDYDAERAGYNLSVEHRPACIMAAGSVDDVVSAVRYANAHHLAVAVIATGHGPARPADGALLVNTTRMDRIDIDPVARTARVEAGVRGGALVHAAAEHGLAPLNGSSPEVGVVSYHLGGGVGMMGRSLGWAVDHVRALDIVTSDGELRHVTPTQHPDLFWALRGAGRAMFGIVTAIEIDLHPITRLHAGGMHFVGSGIAGAMHTYAEWTHNVPESMGSSALLIHLPDLPAVPEPLRGRFSAHLRFASTDSAPATEPLLRPFRVHHPVIDTVADIPYSAVASIHNEPTTPVHFHGRNSMLRDLDPAAVDILLKHTEQGRFMAELRHLGGALGRPGPIPAAQARRDDRFVLYTGGVSGPADIRPVLEDLQSSMQPWATGAACVNFLSGVDVPAATVAASYLPDDVMRISRLRQQVDPSHMFRFHHGVW